MYVKIEVRSNGKRGTHNTWGVAVHWPYMKDRLDAVQSSSPRDGVAVIIRVQP
jgi:hypothetical protein